MYWFYVGRSLFFWLGIGGMLVVRWPVEREGVAFSHCHLKVSRVVSMHQQKERWSGYLFSPCHILHTGYEKIKADHQLCFRGVCQVFPPWRENSVTSDPPLGSLVALRKQKAKSGPTESITVSLVGTSRLCETEDCMQGAGIWAFSRAWARVY